MLLKIHDVVSGWIAGVIVALIIIVFAFFGVHYYFDQSPSQNVAKVGDQPITVGEFQRAYQNYRQQLQQALGQSIDSSNNEFLKQEALNQLIEAKVLSQLTHAAGMRISDEDLVAGIGAIEPFQDDNGKFSQRRYEQALQRVGMSSSGFEQQMRSEMLMQQLRTTVVDTAFVTAAEIDRLGQIQAQTRDIRYATIAAQPLYDGIEVTDADVQAYYESNIDDYREPEKVRIAYIDLTIDSLLDDVSVSEEDLRAYYESNPSAYTVDESRKVTQMYIKLGRDAEQDRVDAARQSMELIQEKLEAGMTMDEVAKEYEDQLGPDFEQISLGFTPRGIMAPELDETVFAMNEGEVSDIIHSDVGMHIVRLDAVKPGGTSDFAKVREQVEEDYRRQQAEQLFFEQTDRLATLAYEHPETLETAAEALDAEIQTSGWFSQGGGDGIAAQADVNVASFSDEVLKQGLNSELIELGNSRVVVLRVVEHQPQQPLPLEQVRDEIIDDIRYERAREQAADKGKAVLQALNEGQSAEAVAQEYGIDWQQADAVSRDGIDVSRAVLRTAFSVAAPEEGAANYDGSSLGSGDYIVVGVTAVQSPGADTLQAEKRQQLREQLVQAAAQNAWQSLLENAKSKAEITVNRQNL